MSDHGEVGETGEAKDKVLQLVKETEHQTRQLFELIVKQVAAINTILQSGLIAFETITKAFQMLVPPSMNKTLDFCQATASLKQALDVVSAFRKKLDTWQDEMNARCAQRQRETLEAISEATTASQTQRQLHNLETWKRHECVALSHDFCTEMIQRVFCLVTPAVHVQRGVVRIIRQVESRLKSSTPPEAEDRSYMDWASNLQTVLRNNVTVTTTTP